MSFPRPEAADGCQVGVVVRLIYTAIRSLDGYTNDRDGKVDWAEPDGEVQTFQN